ncbi:MAG: MscL family protein, partial [Mogibacterium diversum]|nr:MscL family protein [Mogibacterium diversum]
LTVFIIIKALSKAKRKQAEEPVEEDPAPTPEVELLTEIRDLLSKRD